LPQVSLARSPLKLEREILSKAAAWFARETNTIPQKVPVRERSTGGLSDRQHVACGLANLFIARRQLLLV